MKIHSATTGATKTCIALIALAGCCLCACDVYFANEYEFVCIKTNNPNTAHYETVYRKLMSRCAGKELQHNEIPDANKGRIFRSIDCSWEPRIFEKFASSEVQSIQTGPQNPNRVLQDYVFNGFCDALSAFLRSANIDSIELEAFDCMTKIQYLDLSENRLNNLPTNFLKEMTDIRMLNLSYNRIQTLEKGMFDNNKYLKGLDLIGNKISFLPDAIFHRLLNLEDLFFGENKIEHLGHLPFSNLTRLQRLTLQGNKLKSLENVFQQNEHLQLLMLTHNEIQLISENVFRETKQLTEIYLSGNRLEQVTPEIFGDLLSLQILNLSYNQITELKNEPFVRNNKLIGIDLSGNKLSEIKNGDFQGLPALHTLYLGSNSIENLGIDSFKDMPGLEGLYMEYNLLSTLHTEIANRSPFSNTAITKLILINNDLKNMSNVFHNTSITYLDISGNMDLILESDSFAGLTHLKTLHMKNCNIIFIPDGVFANTPQLSTLVLQYNKIHAVTPNAFASLSISVIDLSYNNIEGLTNYTFVNCKGVVFLNFSHNSITQIERETFGMTNLKGLDLKSNFLKEITVDAPDLTLLIINHNSITSLNGIFEDFQKLQFLDVAYNNLTVVTLEQWRRILHLKQFLAKGNRITEVTIPEIDKVFTTLNLEHNKIKKIHMPNNLERKENDYRTFKLENNKVLMVSYKTIEIYLEGNPIDCDCFAYKLYEYLINFNYTRDYVVYLDDLICHYPLRLRGKKLAELAPTDLVCNYKDECKYFQCDPPAYDCLENCSCLYRPHGEFRSVNCSSGDFDSLPQRIPEYTTLLDLNGNRLSSLAELNQSLWDELREIHVEGNAVDSEIFDIPDNVTFLGLKDNRLRKFPDSIRAHADKIKDFRVTLSGNLFQCDCSAVPLKEFLLTHENQVDDIDEIDCISSDKLPISMANMTYADLCPSELETTVSIAMYIVGAAIFIISVALSIFYYKYKLYILSFLYTHCNCCYRLFCCSSQIEKNKIFDGFIAHSSEDDEVALGILQELEPQYHFCIHQRNWMPGSLITNNIIYSVKNSRKTLVVLSEKFLESKWFHLEFQAAFNQTLWDKTDRLLLIVKGKLPDSSQLPDNVKYVLKTKTYLEWGEKWFFEKLKYAMQEQRPFVVQKQSDGFSRFFSRFRRRKTETQHDIEL